MMVPLAPKARMGHRRGQPVWRGKTQLFSLLHCCWGVAVGAETARVVGLQRLAIVSHREAIDRMLAPPCVQRMEQLRVEAVAVMSHWQHVREVVCRTFSSCGTHSNVSRKPPSFCASSKATARACSESLGHPPKTNSPSLPPTVPRRMGAP